MLALKKKIIQGECVGILCNLLLRVRVIRGFFLVDPILNWLRPLLRGLFLGLWRYILGLWRYIWSREITLFRFLLGLWRYIWSWEIMLFRFLLGLWWRSRRRRLIGDVDRSRRVGGVSIWFLEVFRFFRSQLDFLKNRVDSLIDLFLRLRGHRPVLFHLLVHDLL